MTASHTSEHAVRADRDSAPADLSPSTSQPGRRLLGGRKALPRNPLRLPAAAAALVAAAAHLPVIPDHLREVPYIGWLFIGLSALCVLGAVALLVDDTATVWLALGTGCAAAVLGYLLSRGPGLPAMADDLGDWANPLGLISVAAETLVAGFAVSALVSRGRSVRWAWAAVPAGGACLALAVYPLGGLVG